MVAEETKQNLEIAEIPLILQLNIPGGRGARLVPYPTACSFTLIQRVESPINALSHTEREHSSKVKHTRQK